MFVYTVLLHFLVFSMLARASHHHSTAEQLCSRQHHMVHEMDADAHHTTDPFATATEHAESAVAVMGAGLAGGAAALKTVLSPAVAVRGPVWD